MAAKIIETVEINSQVIADAVPAKKVIASGRVSSKLEFVNDDTDDGVYEIVEIKIGGKGLTLVTNSKQETGKLAFFEAYGTPLADFVLNSSNVVTAILGVVSDSEVSYEFGDYGYYSIDAKSWKLEK